MLCGLTTQPGRARNTKCRKHSTARARYAYCVPNPHLLSMGLRVSTGSGAAAMRCFLQVLQGLMTPVIALIAVYIAWQQWRTNADKVKLDKFDRRFPIY